ncbi:MAG: hypothetical protein CVU11_01255 [Bacteroidetes bacterium HGW-Bacteroidetes-6]|jgi:Cu(I)/Ag(I) efflux system membrane fusion protein|nr:MAG: hypothetical protein CVU11_01255 [Bacteroidetes bacterium HGW-Bacteroidetes-6]
MTAHNKYTILLLIAVCLTWLSCNSKHDSNNKHSHVIYTCSMHPQIRETKPGNCPICGMVLVEKSMESTTDTFSGLGDVLEPTYSSFLSGQKVISADSMEFPVVFDESGILTYDTRYISTISSRIGGRIEKLYIRYTYQFVSMGQRLFDIYSPELLTEQENLLFLTKNDSTETELINSVKRKLLLSGMQEAEIRTVLKTGVPMYSVPFYSPASGYIVPQDEAEKTGTMPVKNKGMNNMGGKKEPQYIRSEIREGDYIDKGQTVFNVADNRHLWAVIKVHADVFALLKEGMKADIFIQGSEDKAYNGMINYIESPNPEDSKMVNIRVYITNPNGLFKVGQLVSARIYTGVHRGLWVPRTSVLDLGKNNIVFCKEKSVFRPRKVVTGLKYGEWTEILSGITRTDSIAENAQALTDNDSFINTGKDDK